MAYLISIENRCKNCTRKATVEVFNDLNASLGYYCKACGKRKLKQYKDMKELEERRMVSKALAV